MCNDYVHNKYLLISLVLRVYPNDTLKQLQYLYCNLAFWQRQVNQNRFIVINDFMEILSYWYGLSLLFSNGTDPMR